jgi:hypothetical protein
MVSMTSPVKPSLVRIRTLPMEIGIEADGGAEHQLLFLQQVERANVDTEPFLDQLGGALQFHGEIDVFRKRFPPKA